MEIQKRPARLGRPPKHEDRNTRERILDAAIELFARQGIAGTSLRQIAQAVGIKESAIYAHFEGKEALCPAIFARFGPPAAVVDELLAVSDPSSTIVHSRPEVVLREMVQRVIARWNEPQARLFVSLLLREGMGGSAALMRPAKQHILERLTPIMQQWMDQGLVRKDFAPEVLIWEFLTPLTLIRISYWHAQATEEEVEHGYRLAERHIDYFLRIALIDKTNNG
jgi:AcrR family transcriptional regulator